MIGAKIKKDTPPTKTHLRKGDVVRVVTGKEKGKQGKVLRISRVKNAVWVEQLNLIKRHTKANQKYPKGGILEREGVLSISNVMVVCLSCERTTRLAAKVMADGKKLRICRRCGEALKE